MEIIFFVLCLVLIGVIGRIFYENSTFRIKRYTICHEKIGRKANGLKIAFLSDLHNSCYGRGNSKLLQAIQDENPDLILIGGDMLIGKNGDYMDNACTLLQNLSMKFPVYYANGNHESRMKFNPDKYEDRYQIYEKKLKAMGVSLLCNESVFLEEQDITITGLELDEYYYQKGKKVMMEESDMEDLVGVSDRENFQILLAHHPEFFEKYSEWGANLVLSGHNHGGIVRLPLLGGVISPQYRLFPKYDGGLYKKDGNYMVLSRGLGTHTIKIRLWNVPELCMIELKEKI
ncbi:MAG: metallophosphoesterase [Firmicutes bacterium]|uniref:Metallophosphoesterase n=1 Tax=Candidatus Scybalomonas excrementavium TaxID=2840943 RepID=A0A9D9N8H5_9FIRM|nr:metallophosphoesterase [Candidatus Scybalomonas excrementavium]